MASYADKRGNRLRDEENIDHLTCQTSQLTAEFGRLK